MPDPAGSAGDVHPLSRSQSRLWFLDQVSPNQSLFCIAFRYRISGPLRTDLISRALTGIVERHHVLRTGYESGPDGPLQRVHAAGEIPVTCYSPQSTTLDARAWLREQATLPFDLRRPPMVRAAVATVGEDTHELALTVHHIAADATSIQIIDVELWSSYEAMLAGGEAHREPLPLQYAQIAERQLEMAEDGQYDRDLKYWRAQLEDAPYLELPPDHNVFAVTGSAGADVDHEIGPDTMDRLERLARSRRSSLFIVLQAALAVTLHRQAATSDIVTGTATAGRTDPAHADLVGFLVNLLVLRVSITPELSFLEVLDATRNTVLDALDHQEIPFDLLVQDLRPSRTLGENPLFQLTFQLLYAERGERRIGAMTVGRATTFGSGQAWFDLVLAATRHQDGCTLTLSFTAARYEPARMKRVLADFAYLLDRVADDPSQPVWQLAGSPATAVAAAVHGATAGVDVLERIRRCALAAPDAEAVSFAGRSITYRDLLDTAELLAARLRTAGVRPGDRVGLHLEAGEGLVTAMLATFMAGASYVPLPPSHPTARLRHIATISGPAAVVTDSPVQVPEGLAPVAVSTAEPGGGESAERPTGWPGGTAPDSNDIAYILFTSGSTGAPKGVCVTHGNLAALVEQSLANFALVPGTRVMQLASPTFDVSVFEILATLATGGCVCIAAVHERRSPVEFADFLRRESINVGIFPPALLSLVEPHDFPALSVMAVGGEAFAGELVNRWNNRGFRFVNAYGPTETTVISLVHDCAPEPHPQPPPIGRAVPGEYAMVVDYYGRPAPVGVPGELVIGGAGVARGYLGDEALTSARFVASPFGPPGTRMYRTGDVCVLTEDGSIRHLGRIDDQVKIRGHRIGLGEVERAVAASEAVDQVAVIVSADTDASERRLIAFVTSATGVLQPTALRRELAATLPTYMIPASFVLLEVLPLNSSGKVDRRALADRAAAEPPPTHTTTTDDSPIGRVKALFDRHLRIGDVPADVSFFDLGGNSLQLATLCAEVRASFAVALEPQDLLVHQSAAELADLLTARSGSLAIGPATDQWRLLERGPQPTPVVLVHDGVGSLFGYRQLQRALAPSRSVYGLDVPDPLADDISVTDLAEQHLATVRRRLDGEPFVLAGWSFGGVIAHEMFRRAAGVGDCSRLVIIDAVHPDDRPQEPPELDRVLFEHLLGNGVLPSDAQWLDTTGREPGPERLLEALCNAGEDADRWPAQAVAQRLARFEAFWSAAGRHRLTPVSGDVRFVRAQRTHHTPGTWATVLPSDVMEVCLPGDHFDVVRGANADAIARLIDARFEPHQASITPAL